MCVLRQDQHRSRPLARGLRRRLVEGLGDLRVVVAVDVHGAPAVGVEALADVLVHRLVEVAVERDLVVVVDVGEVAQAQVAGERCRLRGHALHEIPVRDDAPDAMVEQAGEARLGHAGGDRHADAVAEALPERAGGRLDAGREVRLGVARRLRSPLAEILELVERQIVARQVQERVEQHRAVAGRQYEAIAIGPVRIGRIVLQVARPENEGVVGGAHGQTRVAALGLFDGVDREELDGVDGEAREVIHAAGMFGRSRGRVNPPPARGAGGRPVALARGGCGLPWRS